MSIHFFMFVELKTSVFTRLLFGKFNFRKYIYCTDSDSIKIIYNASNLIVTTLYKKKNNKNPLQRKRA